MLDVSRFTSSRRIRPSRRSRHATSGCVRISRVEDYRWLPLPQGAETARERRGEVQWLATEFNDDEG